MLTIRPEQQAAMGALRDEKFVAQMCLHCRTKLADATSWMDDTALAAMVRERIAVARSYGITSSRDLCRFLNLAAAHGWNFEQRTENKWMHDILADPDIDDPSNRLHRLIRACSERQVIEQHNAMLRSSFIVQEE